MQILQKTAIRGYTNIEGNNNNTEITIPLLGLWTDVVAFNLGHAVSAHPLLQVRVTSVTEHIV